MVKFLNSDLRKKICFVFALCWMIVIFSFSARTAAESTKDSTSIGMLFGQLFVPAFAEMDPQEQLSFADKIDHPIRKTAHATEYAVLGFFLAGSYADRKKKRAALVFVPLAAGAFYAVTYEVHQLFVPGRSCQVTDMLIDSCGVLAGVLAGLALFLCGRQHEKKKRFD